LRRRFFPVPRANPSGPTRSPRTPRAPSSAPACAPALAAAVQSLDAALAVAPPGPAWGHADALVWLGIAQQRAGDTAAARAAWQQALAIEPGFAWVKYALLPSLDRPSPSR
jgi:tetratricopeptide (TPR) repeat protein